LEGLAERKAAENGLDPALLKAVIEAESGWNVRARSRAGALGLMQLMPATAAALGVSEDVLDPERNLDAGARYLSQKISEFGDVELALAAYNAGSSAVRRHGNAVPPFPETQAYVKRVMEAYRRNSLLR
jgi:soluble lytic murein transglycosylase-like protein